MKTKNRKTNTIENSPAESTKAPSVEAPDETVKLKIAVPLNEDGSFDMDTMRDKTKERLKKAINSTPGLKTESPGETAPMFPPMVIWTMYRSISALEVILAQRIGNIPPEISQRVFTFTQEELNALTPPTSRVLAKYAKEWMIKYQDEITLATLLTTMTIAKVNAAIMLSKQSQGKVVEIPKKDEPTPEVPIQ